MKKSTKQKKLSLNTEKVRDLVPKLLRGVFGGFGVIPLPPDDVGPQRGCVFNMSHQQ
jgi:hypothetical protein